MHLSMVIVTDMFGGMFVEEFDSLDWGSKEDKNHFKDLTTKIGTVIMGRKTFESIGRPLPNRLNIVLTHKNYRNSDNVIFLRGTPENIINQILDMKITEAAIIGGKKVFEDFLPFVDKIFITLEPIILKNSHKLNPSLFLNFKLVTTNVLNENGTIVLEYKKIQ
ncbi:dihydrofolate reductase [Thermosipho atlanticus]|uniref:dihydrofolate reductase n=1 Tax=Thermosipho atlanticus DSM 15807 TaxID=1123380 RepID=A0A1M5TZ49_9BACT|nr:dihydrofolate reductase [Thermosipho atlanticus]SHH56105.1 dihydrofolate reductase [Thermosipho atlanticus DSM 15807]